MEGSLVVVCGVVSRMLGSVYSLLPPSKFITKIKPANVALFLSREIFLPFLFTQRKVEIIKILAVLDFGM